MLGSNASIAFDTDRLYFVSVGFKFIIHYAELVPPNTEHDLGVVNIRFGRQRGSMVGISP